MQIACSSASFSREIPARLSLTQFPAWCGSRGISALEIDEGQLPALIEHYWYHPEAGAGEMAA